jgi:hypothetical protein
MSFLNTNNFLDRQAAAAAARKALAEKFRSQPKYDPSDPAILEREAKRRAVIEARAAREEERKRLKVEAEAAEAVRREADQAVRLEAERQAAMLRETEDKTKREETERLAFEAKLDRDARYAARKERKKKRLSAFERFGLK